MVETPDTRSHRGDPPVFFRLIAMRDRLAMVETADPRSHRK
jgi:hypothetical protein